jgi:threonylcarbamoyladenosine tRNA methylthiotransferase MtaB
MNTQKRASIITLGCKVNWYDSQAMAEAMAAAGFVIVGETEPADVYVVNTCAVTAEADRKSRQAVRRLLRLHPDAAIIAAGCSAQRDPDAFSSLPGIAAVCGTGGRADVAGIALAAAEGARGVAAGASPGEAFEDIPADAQSGHTRATLKIEDGCDARCAYCIIPGLRGAPRSRPLASVSREAEALAARGFREIVLVGINLARYGADLPGGLSLADAAEAAAAPGVARIRLGSIEPETVTEGLLRRLRALPQFCPHFHVSLQSGSAETLKRMGRRYNPAQYLEKLALIRAYFPDAGVTTDVIAGFPGETDREFSESAAFVSSAGFLKVHVFPYSRRPGTPAADMPGQVPNAVKAARAAAMQAAAAPSGRAFLAGMLGKTLPVLFESPVEGRPGWMRGYAPNYVDIMAEVDSGAKGKIAPVHLIEVVEDIMIGHID